MAAESGIIASAFIVPNDVPPPSKRRQSSTSDSTSKRPRYSDDGRSGSQTLRDSPQPMDSGKDDLRDRRRDSTQDRRKSSMQEERKRGQRLFGGLLSTLSQSTPNGQQKRRQEVEKRQQEKAKQQKAADEKRRKELLADLKIVRETEQIKFNEEAMRTRHNNLLAKAHFLSTKSEPKLYYKPWEMLPAQEERIKQQIANAKTTIEFEVAAFYAKYPTAIKPVETPEKVEKEVEETNVKSEETVGEPQVEPESLSVSASNVVKDATNSDSPVEATQSKSAKEESKVDESKSLDIAVDEHEHNGEVVLENEEDTVIY